MAEAEGTDRLTAVLVALERLIEQQSRQHEQLVSALVSQLAAGQAETLYALQSAHAALQQRVVALEQLGTDLPEAVLARFTPVANEVFSGAAAEAQAAMHASTERMSADASSVIAGVERAGHAALDRIIDLLDQLDERERRTEERAQRRMDRAVARFAELVDGLRSVVDHQIAELHARDASQQEHLAHQLQALVAQMLAAPRGTLRGIRAAARAGRKDDS